MQEALLPGLGIKHMHCRDLLPLLEIAAEVAKVREMILGFLAGNQLHVRQPLAVGEPGQAFVERRQQEWRVIAAMSTDHDTAVNALNEVRRLGAVNRGQRGWLSAGCQQNGADREQGVEAIREARIPCHDLLLCCEPSGHPDILRPREWLLSLCVASRVPRNGKADGSGL